MSTENDFLEPGDGGKAYDSDSGAREPLDHAELFAASLGKLKRPHEEDDDDEDDDDSVGSGSRKKLRFGELLGVAQKSPLMKQEDEETDDGEEGSVGYKTDEQEEISQSPLENILDRSAHTDALSATDEYAVDDSQNPSSDRILLGMGSDDAPASPSMAQHEGHRAQVFGIGFTQVRVETHWQAAGSPIRDAPAATDEHQPLHISDTGNDTEAGNSLDPEFGLAEESSVGTEKKIELDGDSEENHFPGRGGKTLPKLDNSRASLDHPDDDRLVAADTEVPSSVHSPSDFQPDSQSSQPIPIPMQAQPNQIRSQGTVAPHQNHPVFPHLPPNPMQGPGTTLATMMPYGHILMPYFPSPMSCHMMQQRFLATGGFGMPRPFVRPPGPPAPGPSPVAASSVQPSGIPLGLSCDQDQLSEYQVLIRNQLEVFEATQEDVESNTQGRKKQVHPGQVGIRCRHCASYPLRQRGRGAVYYPAKLQGIYQAAQNMTSTHLCESCQCIPPHIKQQLCGLRERRDTAGGGKQYWADGARALGLQETKQGLKFKGRGDS